MVISFSDPQARAQLLEKGVVYTFRKNRRKKTGKDWANEGRLMPKLVDVEIEEIGEFKVFDLEGYVPWSGFENLAMWFRAVWLLNKRKWDMDRLGWLYRVTLQDSSRRQ